MGMDRNTIIGLTLIVALMLIWQVLFIAPESKKKAEEKRMQDSIVLAERRVDSLEQLKKVEVTTPDTAALVELPDSVRNTQLAGKFGAFATAAVGKEQLETLENDVFKVTFSNKGGRIVQVELKHYNKISEDAKKKEIKSTLRLLDDPNDRFEYLLPVTGAPDGKVRTGDLYFTPSKTQNSITFRADAGNGRYFEQKYTISPGTYKIGYDLQTQGMNSVLNGDRKSIPLYWLTYLDKLEKNTLYERQYSTVYLKPVDDQYSYVAYTSNDSEDYTDKPIKWVSHANQFFNTSIIAKSQFNGALVQAEQYKDDAENLKKLQSEIQIPYNSAGNYSFGMDIYAGPNEFKQLRSIGVELEDVIPYGWGIFGTINRWIIRPIFNFLSTFIGSAGIVILMLTFIVKLILYPLTYRMLYSQSKMGALKPQLEGLKTKFKDDPQQLQMEQMKIYREFGVNPLGGCLPMLLQMPIWFALYRFFPAAIEFRQAGFLWATDLSSYDVFMRLPFEIPFGFGSHISLFTFLWAITTLIYTYYSTRHMDMSANPALKYMQYIMPVMFLGFFNSYASGLTCYLLFSNLINIGQTIATKTFLFNEDKIRLQLEENRKKPKKKGGFQERIETALNEQKKIQAQRQAATQAQPKQQAPAKKKPTTGKSK